MQGYLPPAGWGQWVAHSAGGPTWSGGATGGYPGRDAAFPAPAAAPGVAYPAMYAAAQLSPRYAYAALPAQQPVQHAASGYAGAHQQQPGHYVNGGGFMANSSAGPGPFAQPGFQPQGADYNCEVRCPIC